MHPFRYVSFVVGYELVILLLLEKLGSEDIKSEIIQQPEKKKFGLFGGSPAVVRAYIELTPLQQAEDYLKKILNQMKIEKLTAKAEKLEDLNETLKTLAANNPLAKALIEKNERKMIVRTYLNKLEEDVKGKGLPWTVFDEKMAKESYRENEESLKNN